MPCTAAHISNSARIIFHATFHLGSDAQDNVVKQWNSVLLNFRENGVANFPSQYPKNVCSRKKLHLLVVLTLSYNVSFKEPSYAIKKLSCKNKQCYMFCH